MPFIYLLDILTTTQCATYDAIATPRTVIRIISLMYLIGQHTNITFCLYTSTQQCHNRNDMVSRTFNFLGSLATLTHALRNVIPSGFFLTECSKIVHIFLTVTSRVMIRRSVRCVPIAYVCVVLKCCSFSRTVSFRVSTRDEVDSAFSASDTLFPSSRCFSESI